MRLQDLLRDPIWQFIGAAIGVVALYLSIPKGDELNLLKVSRVYSSSLAFLSTTASAGAITLNVSGEEIDGRRVTVHYYLLENVGRKPLVGAEFHGGMLIRAQSAEDQILSVREVCSEVCSISPMKWNAAEQHTYAAIPSVINPKEVVYLAVYVLSPTAPKQSKNAAPLWTARITNATLSYHAEYEKTRSFGEIAINIEGWAIYFLVGVALLLIIATFAAARFARILRLSASGMLLCAALAAISFSSAEVAAHLVSRSTALAVEGWVVLGIHVLGLAMLIARGVQLRQRT